MIKVHIRELRFICLTWSKSYPRLAVVRTTSTADPGFGQLRAGFRTDPVGMPGRDTTLSWSVTGEVVGAPQFVVEVRDGEPVWTTTATGPRTVLPADVLTSRRRLEWTVRTEDGRFTADPARLEVGLLHADDWAGADWISAPRYPYARESDDPVSLLRTEFDVEDGVGRARLYLTALGLYRVWLNGVEIGADALYRPGWTDYRVRVLHQTIDCGAALRPGRNALAIALAKGWYAGRVGLQRSPGLYGDRPAALASLQRVDGERATALTGTGTHWQCGTGAIRATDLLRGEIVDLRRAQRGWTEPAFDDAGWCPAVPFEVPPGLQVAPQPHASARRFLSHPATVVRAHARGPLVVDFGQNVVGWTRIRTRLLHDTEVIVRHGEILTPDNLVYRDNLRGAFQEDRYVADARGNGGRDEPRDERRTLEPSFTMHGFRYAEIWGLPSEEPFGQTVHPGDVEIEAVSVSGGQDPTGAFESDHAGLTALSSAIEWTIRDNFIEVPTDCPQRDERLGWLGDSGVIAPTASWYFDVAAFLGKFLDDAADDMGPDGELYSYVPVVPPGHLAPGAPGWADGYVRMLHLLTDTYADLATADRHLPTLTRFLDHIDRHNPDGIRRRAVGADYGDWLSLPEHDDEPLHPGYAYTGAHSTSPRAVVGTAHTFRSFVQAAEIAALLGRDAEAHRLRERAEQVRAAYVAAFVGPDGAITEATQTVYAQAVGFGLLEGDAAQAAATRLAELIRSRGHLTTGIHGVQHVLPVLARHGHADLAFDLLLRESAPSWLWMIDQGGTTIWEKWEGIRPDGSLATAEMNSFNHCALGGVGAFLFEDLLGMRVGGAAHTGRLRIEPRYTRRLRWAGIGSDTAIGRVEGRWEWCDDAVQHRFTVPGGVVAELVIPDPMQVRDAGGGRPGVDGALLFEPGEHLVVVEGTAR